MTAPLWPVPGPLAPLISVTRPSLEAPELVTRQGRHLSFSPCPSPPRPRAGLQCWLCPPDRARSRLQRLEGHRLSLLVPPKISRNGQEPGCARISGVASRERSASRCLSPHPKNGATVQCTLQGCRNAHAS